MHSGQRHQALGRGFGAHPKVLSWDQEPAMVASAHEIWAKHGLRLDFTSPDGHEKVAERNVRTIKEYVYASVLSLGHAIDETMLEGIVRDTVTILNFLPTADVDKSAPRTTLDGERLHYQRWARFSAGQVGQFEIPYPDKASGSRKELGYVICHQGDNAVARLLPSGKRVVIRSAHFTPLEKSPAIIKMIEDGIGQAQKERFNELLAEIKTHYSDPPSEDSAALIPIVPLMDPEEGPVQQCETVPIDDFNFFGSEDTPIQPPAQPEPSQSPPQQPTTASAEGSGPTDTPLSDPPTPPLR